MARGMEEGEREGRERAKPFFFFVEFVNLQVIL